MSAKIALALLVALVAVASTGARRAHANDYVQAYYSRQKVMESCFGRSYVMNENRKIANARASCNSQAPRTSLFEPSTRADFAYYKANESSTSKPYFTQDMVRYLSERLMAKTSNATCILRDLQYMDHMDNLRYDVIINDINNIQGVSSELKRDLAAGARDCRAMAECLPYDEIAYALTPALMRWSNWSKCYTSMIYQSCMKQDLKNNAHQFELGGLNGFLNDQEPREQMYSVVWANTVLNQGADFLW